MPPSESKATVYVQAPNRRADSRHTPIDRAAVWFNLGLAIGETCELKDVSMSGFRIQCDEWQLPVFLGAEGKSFYCVLLLGEAHFGCMARVAATQGTQYGQVGFHFEAIPENSIRLLHGLIECMAQRDEQIRALEALTKNMAGNKKAP